LQKAERLWEQGFTDAEVSKKLKIPIRTLYDWVKRYPELLQARTTAKAVADELVERALFKRATGFVCPDSHVSQFEGKITITPLQRHYPPDTSACLFWLRNRKPKEWRDCDRTEQHVDQALVAVPPEMLEVLRKRFRESMGSSNDSNGNGNGGD
jgi:Homeodomain-like domain